MKFFSQFTDCLTKMKAIDAVFSECERYDPNLTVTVDFLTNKNKNYIYANFDPVNILILIQK
ncbi:hypothetical protein BGV40_00175 [Methanosarcina sp. Ant1]|nr:hypothetical protein BGV40_00175 [Methanosarcina sp. Ant1]